jgi:arginyl-tRNA synthetase
VADAGITRPGYLTVTVTPEALATVAVRVVRAGPACAGHAVLTIPEFTPDATAAIEWAGEDAIRWELARATPGTSPREASPIDAARAARHLLSNPAFAVRYACARASATLRQATVLGLALDDSGEFEPSALQHPAERVTCDALSWLPERAASAARRGRAETFARYLETLADAYLSCEESCPAVRPGILEGTLTGEGRGSGVIIARLWLAAAARTGLGTGLTLLGVSAPDRL